MIVRDKVTRQCPQTTTSEEKEEPRLRSPKKVFIGTQMVYFAGLFVFNRPPRRPTLRASLSGIFLQTLPDLVTPLKGHSLSPRSCPATGSAPTERFGYLIKLQALVYDILPSTTAVFSYVIGSRKLSVNEQFFVGGQTVVSLLQTTQIKQGVSFIAANKVYTRTNKPQSFE